MEGFKNPIDEAEKWVSKLKDKAEKEKRNQSSKKKKNGE